MFSELERLDTIPRRSVASGRRSVVSSRKERMSVEVAEVCIVSQRMLYNLVRLDRRSGRSVVSRRRCRDFLRDVLRVRKTRDTVPKRSVASLERSVVSSEWKEGPSWSPKSVSCHRGYSIT